MKRKPKPQLATPGSPFAVVSGCTCSPLANNYGRGFTPQVLTGVIRFRVAPGCPMHDKEPRNGL